MRLKVALGVMGGLDTLFLLLNGLRLAFIAIDFDHVLTAIQAVNVLTVTVPNVVVFLLFLMRHKYDP